MLQAYIANPICSLDDLQDSVDPSSPFLLDPDFRRSIAKLGGGQFYSQMLLMSLGTALNSLELRQIWDKYVGIPYNFAASRFQELFNANPDWDPLDLVESVLCNIGDAGELLDASLAEASELCVEDTDFDLNQAGRRDLTHASPKRYPDLLALSNRTESSKLGIRTFDYGNANTGGNTGGGLPPWTGSIMQAVIDRTIPLLYVRQLRYRGELNLEGELSTILQSSAAIIRTVLNTEF
jgi:hypothetical protein